MIGMIILNRWRRRIKKMEENNKALKRDSECGYKKILFIIMAFAFIMGFRFTIMERVIINGNSMYPFLEDGDVCIVWKFNVKFERGDIVTAKVGKKMLIKRIVGLPGETLQIMSGCVYIDGKMMEENIYTEDKGLLMNPYVLGENEYFIMGDNRGGSNDSRKFGSVNINDIKGKVMCRIFPFPFWVH